MIKEERQRLIIEKLNRDQKINLLELSQLLNVSYDSIRRDVIELEDKGLLKKVHGGAVANSYLSFKTTQGFGIDNQEVLQLTRKAQKLFENHQTVFMDGGTTNFHIAEQFSKNLELTVITNSLPLATVLNEHPKIETILLGGTYHKRYQITIGNEVMRQLEHFRADLYLMGFNGLHPEVGVTLRNYEESVLKQKMAQAAKKVAICSITEKLHSVETYKVCDLHAIDILCTSLKPSDAALNEFRQNGIEIL
ncbi:DeoR/GlpR family DNA-binding transcription regulator [Runella sp.]|jgi:DeoR/GlpR family transcriptional regulator of sugar metabolism|uniref:DeoR/GlpR family DNA-binding transcription regulator n=1 Tax=Runella sp. TaxID=1960881 RepID=UPI00260EB6F1|nr:DeoR/GlpR family DNA-binding transcription regulator [Runella sp.]